MERFEQKFKESMNSNVPLLNRITHFIIRRKGKQMRPMFVFLVAKMVSNGNFTEKTYRGAALIELIHTGSLVHDDVVDDSNRRRGFFSINALWKNKIAVLVGDYLFVAQSRIRQKSSIFNTAPVAKKSVWCGITIIHLPTGAQAGYIKYNASVEELYDLKILKGLLRPNILNLQKVQTT